MKTSNLKFIEQLLKVYIVVGFIGCIVGILIMQTQLSVLNLELSSNRAELEEINANNDYLEMQKNENLTREKVASFASSNGLKTSFPSVVDLPEEE